MLITALQYLEKQILLLSLGLKKTSNSQSIEVPSGATILTVKVWGSGGCGSGSGFADAPGGGGSGYISPLGTIINEVVRTDISTPNDSDPDYPGNQVGAGGAIDGNGHIVLILE